MRDGVKLSADVLRPKAEGRFPTLVYRTPYDRKRASEDEVAKAALQAGYAVVLVDVRGRYDSAGVFTPYRNEGARRLRHHRVGGRAALVDRGRRHLRALVSRRRAVARGRRVAAAPEGDGPGDDLLDAAQLLLCRRRLGPVLAVLDLEQHRAGRAGAGQPAGSADRTRGARRVEAAAARAPVPAAADRRAGAPRGRRRTTSTGWRTGRGSRGGTGPRSADATDAWARRFSTSRAGTTRPTAPRAR